MLNGLVRIAPVQHRTPRRPRIVEIGGEVWRGMSLPDESEGEDPYSQGQRTGQASQCYHALPEPWKPIGQAGGMRRLQGRLPGHRSTRKMLEKLSVQTPTS